MAKEKNDRVSAILGGKKKSSKPSKKKGGKKVKGMHIHKASSGGYVARHDAPEGGGPSEEHLLSDLDALKEHVGNNLEGEEEPQAAGPSPAPAQPMA